MNWHETIKHIQSQKAFEDLVNKSYLSTDLVKNCHDYGKSLEFKAILSLLKSYQNSKVQRVLDIGAGNGISAISMALKGYHVVAVEPDPSDVAGAGAIAYLKKKYSLSNLEIIEDFGEQLPLKAESFDAVFSRQCLHHAKDLEKFLSEIHRVLVRGGIVITVRDHVIYDEKDKEWFLESHPLHKMYGGENAFTLSEYIDAFTKNGFEILKKLGHFESVINYYPIHPARMMLNNFFKSGYDKLSLFGAHHEVLKVYQKIFRVFSTDEKQIPGRLYTFVGRKL